MDQQTTALIDDIARGDRAIARIPVPAVLADVALIDGRTAAATASISISQWHELVRVGKAPPPAIRGTRCTRWRVSDVRKWLVQWAADAANTESKAIVQRATKASAAARAKRQRASVWVTT